MGGKMIKLLLFLSLTCFAGEPEPKYHFGDCVKVVQGFYKGCKGTVDVKMAGYNYEVLIDCKNQMFDSIFDETEIVKAKGCSR